MVSNCKQNSDIAGFLPMQKVFYWVVVLFTIN